MRIAICTPLFPPDLGAPAPYVKELASRLTDDEVSVILYGQLPEKAGVATFTCVQKRARLPIRLVQYTKRLMHAARNAEVLYIQNGPSVELPALFVSLISRVPLILCISDPRAYEMATRSWTHRLLHSMLAKRSHAVVSLIEMGTIATHELTRPLVRPEIDPFASYPEDAFAAYEESWKRHTKELINLFIHAKTA